MESQKKNNHSEKKDYPHSASWLTAVDDFTIYLCPAWFQKEFMENFLLPFCPATSSFISELNNTTIFLLWPKSEVLSTCEAITSGHPQCLLQAGVLWMHMAEPKPDHRGENGYVKSFYCHHLSEMISSSTGDGLLALSSLLQKWKISEFPPTILSIGNEH